MEPLHVERTSPHSSDLTVFAPVGAQLIKNQAQETALEQEEQEYQQLLRDVWDQWEEREPQLTLTERSSLARSFMNRAAGISKSEGLEDPPEKKLRRALIVFGVNIKGHLPAELREVHPSKRRFVINWADKSGGWEPSQNVKLGDLMGDALGVANFYEDSKPILMELMFEAIKDKVLPLSGFEEKAD